MSDQNTIVKPVLTEAQMNVVTAKNPVIGTVVSNKSCMKGKSASFVRHTVIDVSDTPLEGSFIAGQSFGIIAPGEDERGKPHKVRLYSLSNGSEGENRQPNLISTTPKRLIDEYQQVKDDDQNKPNTLFTGVCSNYICDLQPGDKVKVTGPNGKRFVLPANFDEHDYLFLATGTGIAPFRGFCHDLLVDRDKPCTGNIHLVMGTPYTTDLLYDDFFRELEEKHPNFHYHTAISREARGDNPRGLYTDGLINEQIDTFRALLENPQTLMYMCGLLGMQFGIYKLLAQHELDAGYQTVKPELADVPCEDWATDQMKRHIRPTARMMVEVY